MIILIGDSKVEVTSESDGNIIYSYHGFSLLL